MTRIERSVVINAPIHEVFKYASDYKKWPEWFENVSTFKPSSEIQIGNTTRYVYRVKMLFFTSKQETEIYDFVENVGWRGMSIKGIPHKIICSFKSTNKLTKFTFSHEAKSQVAVFGPLIDKLIVEPGLNRIIEKSLENLANKFQYHKMN